MRLRFQKRALHQINKVLSDVAGLSPQGAAKVEARISAVLEQVRIHPYSGMKTSISGVRRIYLTPYPYYIDYFTGDEEIVVQRFRHAARRPLSG